MADLKVVFDDLTSMADTFRREADAYRELIPRLTPVVADTGDAGLNEVVSGVMGLVAGLNVAMVTAISEHADKLVAAANRYEAQEIDNRFLYDDLMKGEG